MRLSLLLLGMLLLLPGCKDPKGGAGELQVGNLQCEFRSNPRGVERDPPHFSWELDAPGQTNVWQSAYRVLVYESDRVPEKHQRPCWDSGSRKSEQSVHVAYAGETLQSARKYYWRVQVEDSRGRRSPFSEWAFFETGILSEAEWLADWIHAPTADSSNCPFVRYEFELDKLPGFAPAFVASVGYHELYVNGQKADDAVLSPSVSDLRNRALYSSYDLAGLLKEGKNNLLIWLASGWADFSDANPRVDFDVQVRPICKAQFRPGPDQWIFTGESWTYAPSSTYHLGQWKNSNFGGDLVDDSGRDIAWTQSAVEKDQWSPVEVVECKLKLSSDFLEPNRLVKTRKALSVRKTGEQTYQVTMDSIYTGWMEVFLRGEPGQRISISASSHADREVEFNQTNILVLGKEGEGRFRNRFSYHQVEFITIRGINYQPELADIAGYQVNNDRARAGDFRCSNALLNQIYDNTCYTYESLSTGGMTVDCPHRERLGYGGDGHGSLDIAHDAYASHPFFTKWTQDWVDIQDENGRINHTAPTLGGGGGPAWSGFILTLPWEVYLNYGDVRILEASFPAAQKWLVYLQEHINDRGLLDVLTAENWDYAGGSRWLFLGDWANPHGNEESFSEEASLFNNCYFVYVLQIASEIARILHLEEESEAYLDQAEKITRAVNRAYYDPLSFTYLKGRQTHLVMPLMARIVPDEDRKRVEENLREEILVHREGHFDTGIHGTYFLSKYLTETGRHDLMFTLMTQTTYPSYGEMILRGELTWPEYWHPVNSRVHGCLSGMGGWFQRGILGIQLDPDAPGYKHVFIQPALIEELPWASGYHQSPYGPIEVKWEHANGRFSLKLNLPENTRATVILPGMEDEKQFLKVGSGQHSFVSTL